MKSRPQTPGNQGIALVIVLAFLVLLTVFAVAFLSSVTTDSQSSYTYAKGVQAQQLTQSAINIAMSQIKAATSQDTETMWISQPGMIKTFPVPGAQPKPGEPAKTIKSYRLYSSSTMVVDGSINGDNETNVDQRKEWTTYPAHMVDLNKPATDASGNRIFPILDPRAAGDPQKEAAQQEKIEGFSFDPIPGDKFMPEVGDAPMPVRWLYMLAKGEIVSGRETDRTSATFDAASEDNPVVGRIAFWTDDESCKVNVNTAAGDEWNPTPGPYGGPAAGSYWDVPRTVTEFDKQALAKYQPAQGEYQRYPGHPATTYLSAVFPKLTSTEIGKISSRVERGGSLGGTMLAPDKVSLDADRLYASIDELVFDPARNEQPLTKERLEYGRFFLTAHSRSPEANLFNLPRVAIWPINQLEGTEYRSPYDRLIAFCSSMRNQPAGTPPRNYFFDRFDAYKSNDFSPRNQVLYSYLQKLTEREMPGFPGADGKAGKLATKSTYATDRDQILTEIADYIRSTNLFDDTIEPLPYSFPTKGKQFTKGRSSKTGANVGHGQVTPLKIGTTKGFGRFYTISEASIQFICTGDYNDLSSNYVAGDIVPSGEFINRTLKDKLTANQKRIEAMLLLELFTPSQGWTALIPDMQIRVKGLNSFRVNDTSLGFPGDATERINMSGTSTFHGRAWGGSSGFRFHMRDRKHPARGVLPPDSGMNADNRYPFVGVPITITPQADGTMSFTGGILTVEIYSGAATTQDASNLVQTLTLNFESSPTFPVPSLAPETTAQTTASSGDPASSPTPKQAWWTFSADGAFGNIRGRTYNARFAPGSNGAPQQGALIRAEDVIRSVLPANGDFRLVAARQNVPDNIFTPQKDYHNKGVKMAHSLLEPVGFNVVQKPNTEGKLVEGASYSGDRIPDVRIDLDTYSRTRLNRGDWDTGVAMVMDGPYINKPDEGNNYRGGPTGTPYYDANETQETGGPTFFSPNRLMPSAVTFGSLPTGVFADDPTARGRSWRTLLFRPDPTKAHDGAKPLQDHLYLDLFWMPVVEPYAISEPFSTAGKINLNYQIMPFTYFKRTTGLRALFKSERVVAIPKSAANSYKNGSTANFRLEIDADKTLEQFDTLFKANKPFKSPSEICEQWLVPKGQTAGNMATFWSDNALTGDNLKERPYATLYPRLTTKSNVYSVHYYVQTLKQANRGPGGKWNVWDEKTDKVTGESRGSAIIERYIDMEDPTLPDFASLPANSKETLDQHVKIRVLQNRKFAP